MKTIILSHKYVSQSRCLDSRILQKEPVCNWQNNCLIEFPGPWRPLQEGRKENELVGVKKKRLSIEMQHILQKYLFRQWWGIPMKKSPQFIWSHEDLFLLLFKNCPLNQAIQSIIFTKAFLSIVLQFFVTYILILYIYS